MIDVSDEYTTNPQQNPPAEEENRPPEAAAPAESPAASEAPPAPSAPPETPPANNRSARPDDLFEERLERLGGEPAPVITPEEFARLQRAGQVHIDARGRVRTARRSDAEAGVSLRKRRAWYER
ncbi:MAG: hypothetical protein DIU68_014885 [Chloroflexota bacterium]